MHLPALFTNKNSSSRAPKVGPDDASLVGKMEGDKGSLNQSPKLSVVSIEHQHPTKTPNGAGEETHKTCFKKGCTATGRNNQFHDYYRHTSHHRLRYGTRRKLSLGEVIFWICWIIFGISVAGYMVGKICKEWQSNPTVTTVASTTLPISMITFPAVTICPVNKAVPEKMIIQGCQFNFNFSEMQQIISTLVDPEGRNNNGEEWDKPIVSPEEALRLLGWVAPKCNDLILRCELDGQHRPCKLLFKLVLTDTGFCCTFNALDTNSTILSGENYREMNQQEREYNDLKEVLWNYSDQNSNKFSRHPDSDSRIKFPVKSDSRACPRNYSGDLMTDNKLCHTLQQCRRKPDICGIKAHYDTNATEAPPTLGSSSTTSTPQKEGFSLFTASEAGTTRGLTILTDTLRCGQVPTESFQGLRVYVHASNEFPAVGEKGFVVGPGTESLIGVTAVDTYSSDALKNMGLVSRGCRFADEFELKYYREYSQSSCVVQCTNEYILKQCGCVPFYSPALTDHEIQVCPREKTLDCVKRAMENAMVGGERKDSIFKFGPRGKEDNLKSCPKQCLPSCNKTVYNVAISSAKFPNQMEINKTKILMEAIDDGYEYLANSDYIIGSVSLLRVFFTESTVMQYKRDVLYTGGEIFFYIMWIMFLCLGFCLLPLIYFFIMWTVDDLKRCYQEREMKGNC